MFRELKERVSQRRVEGRAATPRCRRGKHQWRTRGREDALTYFCQVCGETSDKPPRARTSGAEAPVPPGGRMPNG
jgi:hypothetical protein